MGLFFTLLYMLTAYLGPETLFGSLADYHVGVIIVILALFSSILSVQGSSAGRISQSYSLLMMCIAVFLSFVFNRLYGLAPLALLAFVPNAVIFYLIVLNCKSKLHLQIIIFTLVFVCLFTLTRGYIALRTNDLYSPYLVTQANDADDLITRLRGRSFINDPNDFAQLMVSLIPCVFFFWKTKKPLRNTIIVILPVAALVFAMFLTHSRGAVVALLAITVFAARRKIGTVPSIVGGGLLFIITSAIGWSGGREMSVGAGSDRMEAWSTGLQLIRTHPLFGVGFGRFAEHNDITAHNTIVVCAAELGVFGLFSWVMFVLPTFRDMVIASKLRDNTLALVEEDNDTSFPEHLQRRLVTATPLRYLSTNLDLAVAAGPGFSQPQTPSTPLHLTTIESEPISREEVGRLASILTVSLLGYLVAGWFLSRAYIMTLFLYVGIAEVIYSIALNRGFVPPRMRTLRLLKVTAYTSVGLLALVYIMLRIQRMMPH